MVFFQDKYLRIRIRKSYRELIFEFLHNKNAYKVFVREKNFEEAFLLSMPGIPESVIIRCEDWHALKTELNNQNPTINFNF